MFGRPKLKTCNLKVPNYRSFILICYRAISTELRTKLQDPLSQVTALKWSPSGKILTVGCFHGEVLLYSYDNDGFNLTQTINVCGSGITIASWSEDNRYS